MHLTTLDSLPLSTIDSILAVANKIEAERISCAEVMAGDLLCPIFLQESSRTYINATTSFLRMGGKVLPLSLANTRLGTRWAEPVQDFMTLISAACDFAVVRVPEAGTLQSFVEASKIPIINAGNGSGNGSEHPMQALVDLYVIRQTQATQLPRILMVGGKHIRTTRTQVKLFDRLGFHQAFVAPDSPVLNDDMPPEIFAKSAHYPDIRTAPLSEFDCIYHNGLDENPDRKSDQNYVIDRSLLVERGFTGKVMHSLPRLNELNHDVDDTTYNLYFTQMVKAKYVFQAAFSYLKEINNA